MFLIDENSNSINIWNEDLTNFNSSAMDSSDSHSIPFKYYDYEFMKYTNKRLEDKHISRTNNIDKCNVKVLFR